MAKLANVPTPAIRRLSLYLRQLETFQESDRSTVSSRQLGQALGLSDAQVRKDLAYFGQFGYPGVGYRVAELIGRVRSILGTDRTVNVLLVGAGNVGRALASYRGFLKRGFRLVAVFDNDAAKVGTMTGAPNALPIQPLSDLADTVRTRGVRLGILAVPSSAAQSVAERMVAAGIRGLLNFAPVSLNVDARVAVSSVDLAVHLEQLAFQTCPSSG